MSQQLRAIIFVVVVTTSVALSACSGGGGSSGNVNDPPADPSVPPQEDDPVASDLVRDIVSVSDAFAYRRNSPYSAVLRDCVVLESVEDSCALTVLPLIGMELENPAIGQPTIDQIMDRVLVTHDWMGERFETLLADYPNDLIGMFSSATAIVIGSEVRPSNYRTSNGAIHIDPIYLWLTVPEKLTISIAADFRSEFGAALSFWHRGRWQKGDQRAFPFYRLDDNSERTVDDISESLARLLFHELAHAGDFAPRSLIAGLDPSLSVFNAIRSVSDQWLSNRLTIETPLNSALLKDLAGVRFFDDEASAFEASLDAQSVGALFASDGARDFYGYSTIREDFATLVTGVLMSFHYGIQRNVGFVSKPADTNNFTCDELVVAWGERNRAADELTKERARRATELLFGSVSEAGEEYLRNGIGSAVQMRVGESWCDNYVANPEESVQTRLGGFEDSIDMLRWDQNLDVHPPSDLFIPY